MTQSWIVSLFLNCKSAHYNSWAPQYKDRGLLHCPNASAVARFKRAVKLGDITWHAAATDQEAEFFPNVHNDPIAAVIPSRKSPLFILKQSLTQVGMFNASMVLAEELANELGVPRCIRIPPCVDS